MGVTREIVARNDDVDRSQFVGLRQLAFGEELADATPSDDVGTILGYQQIGFGEFPETFLKKRKLLDSYFEDHVFPALDQTQRELFGRLYGKERQLLLSSGLPKAPDAEDYMVPQYFIRDGENVKELKQEGMISVFENRESEAVIFVQGAFKPLSEIEKALKSVGDAMHDAQTELGTLLEDTSLRDLRVLQGLRDGVELPDATVRRIQDLAIWDLHYRNLREIGRTFYMYRAMTEGCIYPMSNDVSELQTWHMQDTEVKRKWRVKAEEVSKEIYGQVTLEFWRNMMFKFLSAYKGRQENLDGEINGLESLLLADMPNLEKINAQEEIDLLKKMKEHDRKEAAVTRVSQFAMAAERCGDSSHLRDLSGRLELRRRWGEVAQASGINAGLVQRKIDALIEERYSQCRTFDEVQGIYLLSVSDVVAWLSQTEKFNDGKQVDADKFAKMVTEIEGMGKSPTLQAQDLVDILSVTEKDLQDWGPDDDWQVKLGQLEVQKYGRKNAWEIVAYFGNMLESRGAQVKRFVNAKDAARCTDDGVYKMFYSTGAMIGVSSNDLTLKIPVTRNVTALKAAQLDAHEDLAHLGGRERVLVSAPGLINPFSGNAPNEAAAKVNEVVVEAMWGDPSLQRINLAHKSGDDDPDVDKIYRARMGAILDVDPENVKVPMEEGMMHILALGLHLGYHQAGERPRMQEVYDLMKRLYLVENTYKGLDDGKAQQEAAKSAWQMGIFRQRRGLWDRVTTKNVVYAEGGLAIQELLARNVHLAGLLLGKGGPIDHGHYQKLFGLDENTINARWAILDRGEMLKNLGLEVFN